MKYYKDAAKNQVYAYENDGSQDAFIKEGLVPITQDEAQAITAEQTRVFCETLALARQSQT